MNVFNKDTCVRRPDCLTDIKYSANTTVKLDDSTLRKFYTSSAARYVYYVDSLRIERYQSGKWSAASPCPVGAKTVLSRWRKASGACRNDTQLDSATKASIAKAMKESKDTNQFVKDIVIPKGATCKDQGSVSVRGASITWDNNCWTHVHPNTLNVHDFTWWTAAKVSQPY